MKTNFFKSIRFKLAVIFTVILFIFSGTIILLFNVTINDYLSTRQAPPVSTTQAQNPPPKNENDPQKDIRAKYSNSLERIKQQSIYGLFVLAVISLALGYYLAGIFLKPLNSLNSQIGKLKTDNLGSQIKDVPNNEIGQTIRYFNEMSLRLKKAFEQQTRFVQDASHELRTPLTILRTNLETVLDDKNASKNELKTSMNDALSEIDSATLLANDLLTLSRTQSKIRQKEDLAEVVNECVLVMADISKKKNVNLLFDNKNEGIFVSINKTEIIRAIKNLIDNAIKYSKSVKAATVLVSLTKENDFAIIRVQDNGKGIPNDDLNKIFDRFYRVDKSRDRETGGFGLGLSITKKIINDHNGKINVKSKPGLTVFTIKLPIT